MATSSVGNIQVTVNADTGKLQAQVVKGATKAGQAGGRALEEGLSDVDGRELIGRLAAIKEEAKRTLAGIAVDIDINGPEAELRRLEAQLRAAQLELFLNPQVDDVALQEMLAELRVRLTDAVDADVGLSLSNREVAELAVEAQEALELAHINTEVELNLDTGEAALTMLGFKESTEADVIQAKVATDLLTSDIRADKALLEAMMGELNIPVDLTFAQARLEMLAFKREQAVEGLTIPVDAEVDDMQWVEWGESAGDSAGRGLSGRWKAIILGIVALAEPAAVALEGVLAPSVSILSSAFGALGGAAGGMVPIFVGMGVAVGTLVVGFQGMGGALKAVTKEFASAVSEGRAFDTNAEGITTAMQGLAPAAQDTVAAFADLMPMLGAIRTQVQEKLFAGMGDALGRLSRTAIPSISAALQDAADSVNTFFRGLSRDAAKVNFEGVFKGLQPALDAVFEGLRSVFRSVEPFLRAATPAAQVLGDSFRDAAESLENMVKQGAKSGALSEFLLDGVGSLKQWWDLIRNVGDALITLFQAGASSGDSMVGSLSRLVDQFDTWMESFAGQTALADFFATGRQLMSDMVPILKGLQGFFDELITEGAINRFGELATALGDVLPFLGKLLSLVGETNVLNTFVELIAAIGDALAPVMPDLRDLATTIGEVLGEALDQVSDSLPGLADSIGKLAIALTPNIAAVIGLIADSLSLAVPLLSLALDAFSALPEPVQTLAIALLAFKPLIGVVANLGNAFTNMAKNFLDPSKALISSTGLWAAGITAAVSVAIIAWDKFSQKQRETEQHARDLSEELERQVPLLLEDVDAANAVTLGHDAMNEALTNSGVEADKLNDSLGVLHLSTQDALDTLDAMGTDPIAALTDLAEGLGLPADQAKLLADVVNNTNENFTAWTDSGMGRQELEELAATLGKTPEELLRILAAMETVQDQQENFTGSSDDVRRAFLNQSAALSPANQALLEHAERLEGVTRTGSGLEGLYNRYTALLGGNAIAVNLVTDAQKEWEDGAFRIVDTLPGLVGGTDDMADASDTLAEKLADTAEEADLAADKADALKDAWDRLHGGAMELSEANDAFAETINKIGERQEEEKKRVDDLADAQKDYADAVDDRKKAEQDLADARNIDDEKERADAIDTATEALDRAKEAEWDRGEAVGEANDALKENLFAIKGNTDAALENRNTIREGIDEAIAIAAAKVREGGSWKEARQSILDNRDALIEQMRQQGFSEDAVKTYIEQLELTPGNIRTAIELANQGEAQKDLDDLLAKFEQADGSEAVVTTKAQGIQAVMAGLDGIIGTKDDIDRKPARAAVESRGVPTTKEQLQGVIEKAEELDETDPHVEASVSVSGLETMHDFIDEINALDGRKVEVFISPVGRGIAHGGQAQSGDFGGEEGPELIRMGPLHGLLMGTTFLPRGTMVTSTALTAAKLRDMPRHMSMSDADMRTLLRPVPAAGPSKQINNTINVTPIAADPAAVATQVLNRAAVLAR